MIIYLNRLIKGKKTYPSWTTNSRYVLKSKIRKKDILIYYMTKTKKKISKLFPKSLKLTPSLSYVLGFLKGEGSTSLGKSNYRRFTITNSDPIIIKMVLDELDKNNLFKKSVLIDNSIHLLHHTESDFDVINYWSKKLSLPKTKFKCFNDGNNTTKFGVCHIYISDVLLRRIIDLIHDEFLKKRKKCQAKAQQKLVVVKKKKTLFLNIENHLFFFAH